MTTSAPYVKSAGKTAMAGTAGRMTDAKNVQKVIRGVIYSQYCYICREAFDLSDVSNLLYLGEDIRKVGKKYKKTAFHLSCDKSLVS